MSGKALTTIDQPDDLDDADWSALSNVSRELYKKKSDMYDQMIYKILDKYGLPREPEKLAEAGYMFIEDNDIDIGHSKKVLRLVKIIETHTIETKLEGNTISVIVNGGEVKL